MGDGPARTGSTTEGLPVAPTMGPGLAQVHIAPHAANVTGRTAHICALAVGVAILAAGMAQTRSSSVT